MAYKFALCLIFVLCGIFAFTHAEADLHAIITNFSRKLFRAVMANEDIKNVIVSPYAIQRILMVALQAARGQLYAEMQRALEVDCIGDVLSDGLFKHYPKGFRYVDQIFHDVETTLRIPYILLAKILFNVSPETIDLNSPRLVQKQINSFIETHSRGWIKNMFNNSVEIHNESSIYFINAVYFEGYWDVPFEKKNRRLGRFRSGRQETLTEFLYGVQYVNYGKFKDLECEIVELPYKNADEKMLILLPDKEKDIRRVQDKILKTDLPNILRRLKSLLVAITMPVFSFSYRTDLSKILPNLGMESLFSEEVDLSNGFDLAPTSMRPRIFQKAFFDFNPYGSAVDIPQSNRKETRGAAHSDYDIGSPDKFFLVERPFLFFLHVNGTIHFIGLVTTIANEKDD